MGSEINKFDCASYSFLLAVQCHAIQQHLRGELEQHPNRRGSATFDPTIVRSFSIITVSPTKGEARSIASSNQQHASPYKLINCMDM